MLTRPFAHVALLILTAGLLALPADAARNCQEELTQCRTKCDQEATQIQHDADDRDDRADEIDLPHHSFARSISESSRELQEQGQFEEVDVLESNADRMAFCEREVPTAGANRDRRPLDLGALAN